MTAGVRRALVFGATGFIGRWLALELLSQQVPVVAAVRSEASGEQLAAWLRDHGIASEVEVLLVDFSAEDLGLDLQALDGVTEVHNLAGAFRFGMTAEEAYQGNVVSARRIVELASRLPGPPRVVHVSGYRVGSHGEPPTAAETEAAYRRLGAYEASKVEADVVVQQTARELGVPFTIVNPSTVSGESATGESDQYLGLATTLRDLWRSALPALPGNADTFIPVVTVDHLARFMALVPTVPEASGTSYWVLDDDTPQLPDLLRTVGGRYQVKVPTMSMPVGLIKRLPRRLTGADPETLSFLDTTRYPVDEAEALAAEHGLSHPETVPALLRWADHLAAYRFGEVSPGGPARGFASYAGIHTFMLGEPTAGTVVLPALPVNADTWADVIAMSDLQVRALDLPGLGMSSGGEGDWLSWLDAVVGEGVDHLVGHSVGAGLALEFAAAHPDRVGRLTLVAPAFLQSRSGLLQRCRPLATAFLRTASAPKLARTLLGDVGSSDQLATSAADLRRRGVARRVARLLSRGASSSRRSHLRKSLRDYPGQVHLVVGEHDPLAPDAQEGAGRVDITTIPGAGHYPQLTHPAQLIGALEAAVRTSS
ncbi:alpha/beta fold hydrolase [Nocardioides humilatus]|uniref:Alpha/beta fold hydrolase n=1 Tax=Nocardioides humilatus TaxID=2607660 RepID=A0A5B1L8G0_9ACTN|nr:alpha/beta fold hydrolase [Nocardioides humilatus]KAA1416912.1 alpha/beta fold hydrolase [Nocardioides humilatus]